MNKAPRVLIVLAQGFEEIEAVTPIDVLRRAGCEVVTAGVGGTEIKGAHEIVFRADTDLDEWDGELDALVLPGGMPGAENLAASNKLNKLITETHQSGKLIGAICASPAVVLSPTGILDQKRATCYPGFEERFNEAVIRSDERVVKDGNIVTSRGPGSAFEFALMIAAELCGSETASSLKEGMLSRY